MPGALQTVGKIFLALLLALSGWGATLPPLAAQAAPPKALINGDTVSGLPSWEQSQAVAAGFAVTVVSGATWTAMTAADFAQYQVLIIGDPGCITLPDSATRNAATWAPVVMGTSINTKAGNRVLIGTDPYWQHSYGAFKLIKDGIAFAGALPGRTGVYLTFGCWDNGQGLATLNMLSIGAGSWTENTRPPCGNSVSLIASNPAFSDLTSADLQGWWCSPKESFPRFRDDWYPLAVATDTPTPATCGTEASTGAKVCGEAYLLIAGEGVVVVSPNISLTPASATDPVGGSHTVTARVTSGTTGATVVGQLVNFTVTGQNAGATGTCAPAACTTDASGNVSFTYTDTKGAGTDTIAASFTDATGTKQQATATKSWLDTTPPSCDLTATVPGPPSQIQVTVQSSTNGLKSVEVTDSTNSTFSIPAFTVGTTSPLVVTATKVDQSSPSTLGLKVTDIAGNVTLCDPTLLSVGNVAGEKHQQVTLARGEGKVTIHNGTNGIRTFKVRVNGQTFAVNGLTDGEVATLDITSAVANAANNATVSAGGPRGSEATVVFST